MRISTPMSLVLVTLVHYDDSVSVFGPFSQISCMDGTLVGESYPEGDGRPGVSLAYYDHETKSWWSTRGRQLLQWTAQSVDEVLHRGHPAEVAKAEYVRLEFPPEASSEVPG